MSGFFLVLVRAYTFDLGGPIVKREGSWTPPSLSSHLISSSMGIFLRDWMKNEGSISIFHSYSCGLVQLDWDSSILSGSNGLSVHYNIRLGTMVSNYDSSVTLILPRVLSNEGFVSDHLCPYAVPLYSCPGCRRGEWGYRAPCNSFKSFGCIGLMYVFFILDEMGAVCHCPADQWVLVSLGIESISFHVCVKVCVQAHVLCLTESGCIHVLKSVVLLPVAVNFCLVVIIYFTTDRNCWSTCEYEILLLWFNVVLID